MLPRRVWGSAGSNADIDKTRHNVNREVARILQQNDGGTAKQHGMAYEPPYLFWNDGIHLSEEGCCLYLKNEADGV